MCGADYCKAEEMRQAPVPDFEAEVNAEKGARGDASRRYGT